MKKILLTLFLAIIFVGNFFEIAQAKIETFEGTGSYPITDEKTHGEVKELAKKEAIRDALEKAGVAIFSQTKVENNIVTKDIIKVTAGSILKVLSDKYKFIPVEEDDGIGMYKATVTISIDTDELNLKLQDFLKRETKEQLTITKQYEELQKLNDENTKRIAELEKQLSEKNSELNKQKILNKVAEIESETLAAKKFEEGNINYYQGYYQEAISKYTESIKLNPNFAVAYNNRGNAYAKLQNYQQAISDWTQAIKINPNYIEPYYSRGFIYSADLPNYEQAIEDFTQVIKLDPNNVSAYAFRAYCYEKLGKISEAEKDWAKAREFWKND